MCEEGGRTPRHKTLAPLGAVGAGAPFFLFDPSTIGRSSRSLWCLMAYVAVVTGGAGYVGTELCKQLLERGWTVRSTVRDACASQRVGHLKRLEAALPGTLQLFEADLLVPGSFDRACQGADYVFHTASPFFIDCADPQGELIAPAVQGTRNVLSSCTKAGPQLRRVVLGKCLAPLASRILRLLAHRRYDRSNPFRIGISHGVAD